MKNLVQLLRESLSSSDQVELGLIKAKAKNLSLKEELLAIKTSLSIYQEEAEELGINYSGALTNDDTPTLQELQQALDSVDLTSIKETVNPTLRRSNFWFVDKQYCPHQKHTRYILANGWERIVTDEELAHNPYFAKQRLMSDLREEGDFQEYHRVKYLKPAELFNNEIPKYESQIEQCFIKIWGKMYWDAYHHDKSYDAKLSKIANAQKWRAYMENQTKKLQDKLRYSILDFLWIKNKNNIETKIKLINLNNKCIAIV